MVNIRRTLIFTLCCVSAFGVAHADPGTLSAVYAGLKAVGAFIVANAPTFIAVGAGVLSALLLQPNIPKPEALKRQLGQPTSRPPYRFVYGNYRMTGTPAPMFVEGEYLYMALILNSRPSAGTNRKFYADDRICDYQSGDIFDFTETGGAEYLPRDFPHIIDKALTFWLSLGDETEPPWAFSQTDTFLTTDAWRGLTVLYVRARAGSKPEENIDRWPNVPPQIECEMDYSLLYDPREAAHDADDPSTWTYSANQALVVLDALRQNPSQRYTDKQIDTTAFEDAADIADEQLALKAGEFETRYEAHGVVIWTESSELMDLLEPLAQAGAGRFVRYGGRVSYRPGAFVSSSHTITDMMRDGGVRYTTMRTEKEIPNAIKTKYIDPNAYEERELPALLVGGGLADGTEDRVENLSLDYVKSPIQAMRIQQIYALKLSGQKRLEFTGTPQEIELIPGSTCVTDFAGEWSRFDGTWEVEEVAPMWFTAQADGVHLRIPMKLSEESSTYYAWDEKTDTLTINDDSFTYADGTPAPPSDLVVTSDTVNVKLVLTFLPSASAGVASYRWEYRFDNSNWFAGGDIPADVRNSDNRVFDSLELNVTVGDTNYDIRVRAISIGASDWIYSYDNVFAFELTVNSVTGDVTTDNITANITTPDVDFFDAIDIHIAPVGISFSSSTKLLRESAVNANSTFDLVFPGSADNNRDYWFVPVANSGTRGAAIGPFTVSLIDPE